jgi:hypothetical protein
MAVPRQSYRFSRDLAKTHGAVTFERSQPGRRCRWHHRSQQSRRHLAFVVFMKIFQRSGFRPGAESVDVDYLLLVGEPDHDRRHTGKIDAISLQDAERDARSNTCIDGIAASLEYLEPCMGRRIVSGRNHVAFASNGGTVGCHAVELRFQVLIASWRLGTSSAAISPRVIGFIGARIR